MSGLPHRALLDPLLVVRTLEDALYVYRRDVDLIGFDLAHLDQVLHFRDGDARRGAHHRAEISGGLAEDQVAPLVALPGAHDGVIGLERLLEDHLATFEHPALLAFGDLRARPRGREEAAQPGSSRPDALGKRPLRVQLDLQLAREELSLELLVLADVAGDHLPDLPALQQDAQALVGGPAVVRDHRQVLHALAMDGGDQVLRVAGEPEPAGHDHSAVLHVADRLVRVGDQLVHLDPSRSTICAMPSPPPMQSEAIPRFLFKSFIAYSRVTSSRAPEAPMG